MECEVYIFQVRQINGKLGVNKTPDYDLDIAGTINASEILLNGQPLSVGSDTWDQSGDDISYTVGNVGIGTATPTSLFSVAGKIDAREIKVEIEAGAPDYVFDTDYPLSSLDEIATYIGHYHHLPEIPSAKEMETEGINLGEMNMLLLKKIEELTLHMMEKEEQFKGQQKVNATLLSRIEKLECR